MVHLDILGIVGPTASGKTMLSLMLAKKLNAEIISADSRQVYRHLTIGSSKPTTEELKQVPHHFIDILDPNEDYNAGEYGQQARSKIEALLHQEKHLILVGGSGLYVRAVIDGFFEGPGRNVELREQLEEDVRKFGPTVLFEKLKKIDPVSAQNMDETKVRRVIRALEVFYATGKPLSELHVYQKIHASFNVTQFGLEWDRKVLYHRIEQRVDRMIAQGLIEEVQGLKERGYHSSINALNTVGYKEVFDFLDGMISKETMITLVKQNTRNFAKRQMTWFRADKRIRWIPVNVETNWNDIAETILNEFQAMRTGSSPN